jgi:hypothetical protein
MRFATRGIVCALVLTGAVVSAQERKVATETKVKSDNGTVETLTGCVMIGGATNFLLTNITAAPAADNRKSQSGVSYALMERDGVDLGQYINQRVQLTGVFVPAATKGDRDDKFEIKERKKVDAKGDATKTTASKETVKVARGAVNQFLVATVKAVAPGCG